MFFFSKVFVPMMAAAALKPEQEQEQERQRKRKRKRKERNQDWSGGLPSDLVAQIMSRFTSSGDGVRFAAVCSSWRLAAAASSGSSKQHPPWLLLPGPQGSKDEHRSLYSISEHKFYRIHLPQIQGQQCVGSGDGWLITSNKRTSQLQLLYFLDGSITPLPSVTTKRLTGYMCRLFRPPSHTSWYFRILEHMHYLFHKVVFFPDVSLVFVIYNTSPHRLAFARLGVDDSWQEFDVDCSGICDVAESLGYNNKRSRFLFQSFYDVVFHKGHFYALYGRGWILKLHVDVDKSLLRCTCLAIRPPKKKGHRKVSTCYLVQSPDGEELMLIWRYFKLHYSSYSYITSYFRVFKCKLTSEEEGEWVRVKCLGDWILFLGENMSSLVLSTKGFPELIPNSIYFTQNRMNRISQLGDMGVFHLDSRTMEPVPDDSSLCLMRCMTWSVPIWIPHTECFPSFTPFKKYMAKEIKKRCAEKIKKMKGKYGRPQQPRNRRSLLKRT